MTVIGLCLDDLSLRVTSCTQVSSENVKTIGIELRRNNRWLDYTMSAVFFTSWSKTVYEVMLEGNSCIVPHEVLDKPGKLYIGIRGVKDDLVKASTLVVYKIEKGAPTGTATAMEPTPDVYQQILKRLNEIDLGVPDAQIEEAVTKYLEANPVEIEVDKTLTFKDGVLSVNCANEPEQDNTLPITSAAVAASIGNIEILLSTI